MKMIQCTFKKEGSETYTQGWVEAKKIKNAVRVQLLNLDEEAYWVVLNKKGEIKDKTDINTSKQFRY